MSKNVHSVHHRFSTNVNSQIASEHDHASKIKEERKKLISRIFKLI